jgi:hypothetical protein
MFKVDGLRDQSYTSAPNKYIYSYLYANKDAYDNSLQPVFGLTSNLLNNCYYPNQDCWYSHLSAPGTFTLNHLSDTNIRATFTPGSNSDFNINTNHLYDHHFKLQFHGFGFGSCTISSIKV